MSLQSLFYDIVKLLATLGVHFHTLLRHLYTLGRPFGVPWRSLASLVASFGTPGPPRSKSLKKGPFWTRIPTPFGEPFRHFFIKIEGVCACLFTCRVLVVLFRFPGLPEPRSARAGAVQTRFRILGFASNKPNQK